MGTTTRIYTIIGADEPFDIRKCPIWAIPQLAFYKRICNAGGVDIEFFELKHERGIGIVTVGIAGQGVFRYSITTWDMNNPQMPELYPMHPIVEPTREIQIGDRVRSKNLAIDGVVQNVRVCYLNGCDKMTLTLDPEMGVARFYYHVESFEIVPE